MANNLKKDGIVQSLTCENLRLSNRVAVLDSQSHVVDVLRNDLQTMEEQNEKIRLHCELVEQTIDKHKDRAEVLEKQHGVRTTLIEQTLEQVDKFVEFWHEL